jgi:uncharacterized spore protein YtfJ
MEMQFEKLLARITNFIQNEAKTDTVIGDPFELGMFNCIPVIRVGMGFGTGGGEGDDKKGHGEGAGAGAGLGIQPIGFLVTKGDEINFVSTRTNTGLAAAFEKFPDLLEKYLETRKETPELVA